MTLIGIDFGSQSCVVYASRRGTPEIVINDCYERKTLSIVASSKNTREFGTDALNQQTFNVSKTYSEFKNQLWMPVDNFDDLWKLDVTESVECFQSIQILSMLFAKLKEFTDAFVYPETVKECVISYPKNFDALKQDALLIAAGIAGWNCRNLIKESWAIAINYCYFKNISNAINVIFVDFGHSLFQVSAWTFSSDKLTMILHDFVLIGGRDFDKKLAKHFIEIINNPEFTENQKPFYVALLKEVEKLKRKVGLDEGTLPLEAAHLLSDDSISLTLNQSEMEQICEPLFNEIHNLLQCFFKKLNHNMDDIHFVEVVGGSSRIPKVKKLIQTVFGKPTRETMNQDEAVAKGCVLSMIPNERRKIEISDDSQCSESEEHQNQIVIEMEEKMLISEMHSNFMGNKKELPITRHLFKKFVAKEAFLKQRDQDEKKRGEARNDLDEFCRKIRQKQEMTLGLSQKSKDELLSIVNQLRYWHEGTTKEYLEKIDEIKRWISDKIEAEKIRSLNIPDIPTKTRDPDVSSQTLPSDSNKRKSIQNEQEAKKPRMVEVQMLSPEEQEIVKLKEIVLNGLLEKCADEDELWNNFEENWKIISLLDSLKHFVHYSKLERKVLNDLLNRCHKSTEKYSRNSLQSPEFLKKSVVSLAKLLKVLLQKSEEIYGVMK